VTDSRKRKRFDASIALMVGAVVALVICSAATGQDATPDRRGEAWQAEPGGERFRGAVANVVIPLELRQQNARGTDRGGICVVTSATTNGRYQGIGPDVDRLFAYAQTQPGGHSPNKLERQIQHVAPHLKYANYLGSDPEVLERLSRAGYPIGATMNTGRLYNYMPIQHMVSLVHFDRKGNLAAVIDNNKPEVTAWMPASEFERRWSGGGSGWAFVWDHAPPSVKAAALAATAAPAAILVYFFGLAVAVRRIRYS
jgi:hypothetical protein